MNWRSPFVLALLAGLVVVAAAFAPVLWQMRSGGGPASPDALGPPWQVAVDRDGSVQALGLRLPGSTLADARRRWGDELALAILASAGRRPALEAYVERWQGGGIGGRLVIAADVDPDQVAAWQKRAPRSEPIEGGARRWSLAAQDREAAWRSAIGGLSFVPSSRVDEGQLQGRFGPPAEVLRLEGGEHHWLYPERGLAIGWDAKGGRAVLQFVAPAAFDSRLRAPLLSAAATAKPGSGPTR